MANGSKPPSPEVPDENVTRLFSQALSVANDYLELATLETRLTVSTGIRMLIMAIVAAIALVSIWLALAGAGVLGLIELGVSPVLAMLLMAAVNGLVVLGGWLAIKHMKQSLGWPGTQRAIKRSPVMGEPNRGVE